MLKKIILIFLSLIIFSIPAFCVEFKEYERLNFNGFIADNANIISDENENALNKILLELQNKTKTDIAIVTLNSLDGRPIESISLKIARKYSLGDKKLNNGALILVAPNDREARIEIGYGLEGIINDSKAGRILDNYMIPYFEKGAYQTGITEGALALAYDIADAYKVKLSFEKPKTSENNNDIYLFMLIFALFIIMPGNFFGGGGFGKGGGSSGIRFGGGGGFGGGGASRKW